MALRQWSGALALVMYDDVIPQAVIETTWTATDGTVEVSSWHQQSKSLP